MIDFTQMKAFADDPLVIDEGDGIRVTDDRGRTYLDGLSGVFTNSLGHGNHRVIAAMTAQAQRLAFAMPTLGTRHSRRSSCVPMLQRRSGPSRRRGDSSSAATPTAPTRSRAPRPWLRSTTCRTTTWWATRRAWATTWRPGLGRWSVHTRA